MSCPNTNVESPATIQRQLNKLSNNQYTFASPGDSNCPGGYVGTSNFGTKFYDGGFHGRYMGTGYYSGNRGGCTSSCNQDCQNTCDPVQMPECKGACNYNKKFINNALTTSAPLKYNIYLEDALRNPNQIDVPAGYNPNTFERSLTHFDPFAGQVLPHQGLIELIDAENLKHQVEKNRINNQLCNEKKHLAVESLLPGFVLDARSSNPNLRCCQDFGGLNPVEITEGEQYLRYYNNYVPNYEVSSNFQNMFF